MSGANGDRDKEKSPPEESPSYPPHGTDAQDHGQTLVIAAAQTGESDELPVPCVRLGRRKLLFGPRIKVLSRSDGGVVADSELDLDR
ncbi:hypothetical protein [Rhodopirellula sp. MGV]|uniref:hypothetical protein n=1 Tax=Rhodopirellula sp. MGV TaxID=2023130 RepID=UPI000B964397|nr:hypothetical protein [Rhodopirellula sp. MGV]OYP28312.1 hypothetical protein CGZ80_26190 [Rhodopirellula sp. MGV]PNY38810.1 hypothetical protein C2E31_02605 [Rhodopirellula baltica]